MIARSVVKSTNDAGGSQTASIVTHRHVDRTDVEIVQPFGLASNPPAGGSMVVLAVGGDQGDLVGLPVAAPGSRLGKLKPGETAVYGKKGDRVHIKDDGSIEVRSSRRVKSKVKTVTVEVTDDRIVGRLRDGNDAPRFVIADNHAKIRFGEHWVAITAAGIFCSVAPVVGPDPDPSI